MKAAQILKQRVDSETLTLGVLVTFHLWPALVEIAIRAGLDYLIIDMEHFTHDYITVADTCAIGRRMGFPVLIRPPDTRLTTVRQTIDLGPCGMLVPCVEDGAMLDAVRDGIYMPPRGSRRPGGPGNYWVGDYDYETWRTEVEDDFVILPQIESKSGLENAEAIARHELATAIGVGPYDLSADLGVCWKPDHPRLIEALNRVREAGRTAGKNMWVIGDAVQLRQRGFTFICVAEITMFLESALRDLVGKAKST